MKAVIDRFEGDLAVLLFVEKEIKAEIPRQLLPPEAREGNWLKMSLELDLEKTQKQEEKISNLLNKLKKKKKQ